jgi:ribosomal protection tetracycline resistance protein
VTAINIGIVAHVDAGKTSLTERILYETHVINEIGRVDKGTTQTDSLELERQRGITIKASVVSFSINDLKVNLIDTPGHADFLAEVERALSVLDAAILVISAVEGIQAQTRTLFTALSKLRIPTLIFINKIDRAGAQAETLIARIKEKLTERVLPLNIPDSIGTKNATIIPNQLRDPAFLQASTERLALNDERLLAQYLDGVNITEEMAWEALASQTQAAQVYPILFGSAITGAGVQDLLAEIAHLLPEAGRLNDAPLSGVVFKLEKETTGERVAYVRVYAGCLRTRTSVTGLRRTLDGAITTYTGKIQALHLFKLGKTAQAPEAEAGEFCKVWGLKDVKIGDALGVWPESVKTLHFATPWMETRVTSANPGQGHQLYQALQELAEEDPLIIVTNDDVHQALYLRIFGEVQQEVIQATLMERFGLSAEFSDAAPICVEKPRGVGHAIETMGAAGNPFKATVGLMVEPGAPGSGVTYRIIPGALPTHFHKAIEDAVRAALAQGLYGWEVTDVVITLTQTGYNSHRNDGTKRLDFSNLVPLVLLAALAQARTDVYEPINQFELSGPADALSQVINKLVTLRAVYEQPTLRGDSFRLTGALPVSTTESFRRALLAFTSGEGVFMVSGAAFRKIEGVYPTRTRRDYDPLNRDEYLLHVQRVWS